MYVFGYVENIDLSVFKGVGVYAHKRYSNWKNSNLRRIDNSRELNGYTKSETGSAWSVLA